MEMVVEEKGKRLLQLPIIVYIVLRFIMLTLIVHLSPHSIYGEKFADENFDLESPRLYCFAIRVRVFYMKSR